MMMRRYSAFMLGLALLLATSCTGNKVYDHYSHTPLSGWEESDALQYDVPPLAEAGHYATRLGLRISSAYPFQDLALIVEQTVYPGKHKQVDTLSCHLFDHKGRVQGQGVSYFQYHFSISQMTLQKGDSLHITVRHNMRREIMPGISDVGIEVERLR